MHVSELDTRRPGYPLDVVAAVFARLLRGHGVAASPAETIEVRRVLGLVGARDRDVLRAALRAVCAKYAHEQAGFDRAFDALFLPAVTVGADDGDGAGDGVEEGTGEGASSDASGGDVVDEADGMNAPQR